MKPLRLLLLFICLHLSLAFLLGQPKKITLKMNYDPNPFAKGKYEFNHERFLSYRHYSNFANDQKTGTSDAFQFNYDGKYFIEKGFAIGWDLNISTTGTHNSSIDNLSRSYTFVPNVTWGQKLSDNVSFYAEAGAGFGQLKQIYKSGTFNNENKANIFGYNVKTGFPVKINQASTLFLTPEASYNNFRYKYDDDKETSSGITISINFRSFLKCLEMGCDCKKGFSKNMYDQGRQYITNPEFYINFGKNKTEINTPPSTDENNFINTRAKLGYGIYFIDNVAAGAHFDYMSWSIKNGTETTQTNFNLSPYIQAHIPTENWWNNMYFLVGGRFGSEKNKVTFGTSTNKDTFKESGWKAGIGANVFIADQTALDLYFQYRNIKTEEKDVPNPTVFKDKGIAFGAGFKYQF